MEQHQPEKGATAVLVAAMLFFLMGAAALAVDVSDFYQDARTAQTTADLACLAGVAELPDDPNLAINTAAVYAQRNWPGMSGATLTISGNQGTLVDGNGNAVLFEAGYDGDDEKMRVAVTEISGTSFGRVLGAESVTIGQEAFCRKAVEISAGGGMLPFIAITGGWTGPLQIAPPCGPNSGNCGQLVVPRDDVNGVGPTLINNIASGIDRLLVPSLGPASNAVNCASVSAGEECSIGLSDPGVSASHAGNGFFDRLDNDPGATCTFSYRGGTLNCDTPGQVLGGTWTALRTAFPTKPGWWDERLLGTYNATNTNLHYWYDGVVAKCDSPRLGGVPIVSENLNWNLGDPHEGWPNGKKDVKVVGLLDVIIEDPNAANDFQGNRNLQYASASVVWYGPNAVCADGSPIGVLNGVPPGRTAEDVVRLVNDTN